MGSRINRSINTDWAHKLSDHRSVVNSLRWFCIAFNPPRVQYVKGSAALSMIFLFPRERDLFSFVLVGGGVGKS